MFVSKSYLITKLSIDTPKSGPIDQLLAMASACELPTRSVCLAGDEGYR